MYDSPKLTKSNKYTWLREYNSAITKIINYVDIKMQNKLHTLNIKESSKI